MTDFAVQKETVSRGIVTGNMKANLKPQSNLFWSEQRTEGWKKGRDEPGEVNWKLEMGVITRD